MIILAIPYATWSVLVASNALDVFDIHTGGDGRTAFAGSRVSGIVWRSDIASGSAEATDYATKYESGSTGVESENDAIAHIIGLELGALPVIQEVRPNLYPEGFTLTFPGRGDHATDGRMLGPRFQLQKNAETGDVVLEFGFIDQIVIAGGMLRFLGAQLGDWVRYDINASASPTPPTSGGTLNCMRVEIIPSSGLYTIVPAPVEVATHYLDLADATKWIPIPAQKSLVGTQRRAPDGHWEWSYPTTGKGVLVPRPNQDGWWNLYEFAQTPLARFVPDANLLGDGDERLGTGEALRPQVILPHWTHKVTLHNELGTNNLRLIWNLLVGRVKPQPGNA